MMRRFVSRSIIRPPAPNRLLRSSNPLFSTAARRQTSSFYGQFSTYAKQNTSSLSKWLAVAAAAGACYLYLGGPRLHEADAEIIVSEASPMDSFEEIDFVHPYDSSNYWWRLFFKVKRTIYLTLLFTPCACVSLVARFTDNERMRQICLDMLVRTFELAGCSFQKFGQFMSMRPDMFPPDLIAALSKLRDQVPPHSYKHTRRMIVESFGHEIEEIFEEFDPVPVASGTVAQVHRARLRPEYRKGLNSEVAVKVRHPHVLDETWLDIDLIYSVANCSSYITVPFKKDEFLYQLQKQVNFEVEANNLQQFAKNFKNEVTEGKIWFPDVSTTLLSPSILVESWASGNPVSDILTEVGDGFKVLNSSFSKEYIKKKKAIAQTVFDMTIKMFLRDNLVHGDLHSGNVMFDEDGSSCTVIDAGLTTSLEPSIRNDFNRFIYAMTVGDADKLLDTMLKFNTSDKYISEESLQALHDDVNQACSKWVCPEGSRAPDGGPISLGDLIGGILFSLNRHDIVLRGDVANSMLTLGVSEGLIRSLDPEFDVVQSALPYFVKYGVYQSAGVPDPQ